MAWNKQANKDYASPEYKRNRAKVIIRDLGMCIRCWTLDKHIVLSNICDHYHGNAYRRSKGLEPDHSLSNLWMICEGCNAIKVRQESRRDYDPAKPFGNYDRDSDGWSINVDWLQVIKDRNAEYLNIDDN